MGPQDIRNNILDQSADIFSRAKMLTSTIARNKSVIDESIVSQASALLLCAANLNGKIAHYIIENFDGEPDGS